LGRIDHQHAATAKLVSPLLLALCSFGHIPGGRSPISSLVTVVYLSPLFENLVIASASTWRDSSQLVGSRLVVQYGTVLFRGLA
jgi:hypothetical protein